MQENNKSGGRAYRNIVLISQISISVMVPIFMCLFIGIELDKYFSTWFTIPMLILGILAGGRNGYVLAMNAIRRDEHEKKKEFEAELKDKLERHKNDD